MDTERFTQAETARETATIVIVEDDLDIGSFLVASIREETPYKVLLTTHGAQAFDLLQNLQPQLIILDYRLPDMDGIEFYRRIHSLKMLEQVPVLFISAEIPPDFKEVKDRHLPLLSKPFELTDLYNEIERLLA
jgi:DNA-binding response OmpR family regulator